MERPKIKDPEVLKYVTHMEEELQKYRRSPYASTYITLLSQINDWNDQLTIKNTVEVEHEGKKIPVTPGKIDLFADKEAKEFERAFKYFGDVLQMIKTLDEIRKLMTPEEQRVAEEKAREQSMGPAEKLALQYKKHG